MAECSNRFGKDEQASPQITDTLAVELRNADQLAANKDEATTSVILALQISELERARLGLCSARMKPAHARLSRRETPPVPACWRKELDRVLITQDEIAQRVRRLGREIQRDFAGREMVIVSLLNGTVMFLADLIRNLSIPLRLDFIGVSSYGTGTESGELVFTKELRLSVRGRDVLLVDDILDTGRTMVRVLAKLRALKPRRIKTCVLLNKAARRVENVEADFVGFEIPDYFVVGYGLDYAERYRNLPFVGVLRSEMYLRNNVQAGEKF